MHCAETLIVLQLLLQISQLLLQLPQLVRPALELILEILLLITQVCDSSLQLLDVRLHFELSCGTSKAPSPKGCGAALQLRRLIAMDRCRHSMASTPFPQQSNCRTLPMRYHEDTCKACNSCIRVHVTA